MTANFKLGITKEFPCNYLPEQKERLLIAIDERFHNEKHYNWLMNQGFRRSGNQIYRPHCQNCQACQSIRVMVQEFKPSKSQKRLIKRNSHFIVKESSHSKESYYPLYERYINTIHHDGTMFPANPDQFSSFIDCNVCDIKFVEVWDNDRLISVAVTDVLTDGLSAVYTFYDPDYRNSGLGVYSILQQIDICQLNSKRFLYLGYQIDECQKMNYKNRYFPYQRLMNQTWQIINK